jgi:hypothetical protein
MRGVGLSRGEEATLNSLAPEPAGQCRPMGLTLPRLLLKLLGTAFLLLGILCAALGPVELYV